jgi:hypothetical protein
MHREGTMIHRHNVALAVCITVALAACDTRPSTGVAANSNATLRVVNATGSNLDLLSGGSVSSGGGNVPFGGSSSCIGVDAANSVLSVRATGATTALPGFAPTLATGGNYAIIAFPGSTNAIQFVTLTTNSFVPDGTLGQSGLAVFNAMAGNGPFDVYVTPPGAALGTPVATSVSFGTASSFFSIPSGTSQVRLTTAGMQTIVLDAGAHTFSPGRNEVLVIAPALPGSSTLRSFFTPAC